MRRRKPNPIKDKKVFKNTADKTKRINISNPYIMRGGTRL